MIGRTALLFVLAFATPAGALDLTGTWLGRFKCTSYDGSKDSFTVTGDTLTITQTGDLLAVDDNFSGFAIADAGKPLQRGEAMLGHCGTSNDPSVGPSEIARLKAKVDRDKGKGKLKGRSVYTDGGNQIGSCRWSYKLMDTADPDAPGCAP